MLFLSLPFTFNKNPQNKKQNQKAMKNDRSSSKETERESSASAYSMGDCTRKCKRNIAAVEGSSTSTSTSTAVSKRMRIVGLPSLTVELENPLSCVALPGHVASPANSVDSEAMNAGALSSSFCSDQLPASWCSSNESSEVVKDSFRLMDLEAKSFETVDSARINTKLSGETTPSSELCGESEEMDSLARKPSATKTPPKEEIEEFFAKAEKQEQKRFAEKYNYDIVKDTPLEGRYQWVRLKP